jgi:hypothetical protein
MNVIVRQALIAIAVAVAVAVVAIADFVIWETTTGPDPIAAPDVQDD